MCMECFKKLGRPSFEPFWVPYYNDRIGYMECSQGHKSALLLQSQKFEVLLESGANALAAGFTLEAASTFSAALERFYEFCLQVISDHGKMGTDTYKEMFDSMARQSERQLGAFMALHAAELGTAYRPNEKITEFRNKVIHKGQIPTPEEAHEFCGKVYAEIFRVHETLAQNFKSAVQNVVSLDLKMRSEQIPKGMPASTTTGTTFFNLAYAQNKATFKEAFDEYIKARERLIGAGPSLRALHLGLLPVVPQSDMPTG